MLLALSIFGVTFAAFCVWLTVRIISRRERWAKWTLAGVGVLALCEFWTGTSRLRASPSAGVDVPANAVVPLSHHLGAAKVARVDLESV